MLGSQTISNPVTICFAIPEPLWPIPELRVSKGSGEWLEPETRPEHGSGLNCRPKNKKITRSSCSLVLAVAQFKEPPPLAFLPFQLLAFRDDAGFVHEFSERLAQPSPAAQFPLRQGGE